MKRRFALRRGKLELSWEIVREGTAVTTRSWGRNRTEIVQTKTFASAPAAKREVEEQAEFQHRRGFVELGGSTKARAPKVIPKGREAVADAKKAIVAATIPALRDLGFAGSFPTFRRVAPDRHTVVVFAWGRAQGMLTVRLGVVPPRKGTTPAEDAKRAFNIRNRQRCSLDELTRETDWRLLSFDNAAEKWGETWPDELASLLAKLIKREGLWWLEAAERRPGRSARLPAFGQPAARPARRARR